MPFILVNAGVTYNRMVSKLFASMIDDTVEAHVNDLLVKSFEGVDQVEDSRKTFE